MNAVASEAALAPRARGAFHAGIVSRRFFETWDFYTTLLDFRTLVENDGYVRLLHASGAELSVLQHELNGEWSELVNATDGCGLWLALEVNDPTSLAARLRSENVDLLPMPATAKWGAASFALRDPNGVLIFVAREGG